MISHRISDYLSKHDIDPSSVAEAVGIPDRELRDALAGTRTLAAEEYAAICRHLDLPIDAFLAKRGRPE